MPSPILARADALMQRRRQSPGEADDIPILTDAINPPDDDIPLLTDSEPESFAEAPTGPEAQYQTEGAASDSLDTPSPPPPHELVAPPPTALPAPSIPEQLLNELARRVEQRLMTELPRLIDATLRDMLAEQAMIDAQQMHD